MAGKPQTLATTSAFEILGPVMVGPSSSHTAGALRCAQVAASLLEGRITKVTFGLWNSFAHTYRGHGTDRALVAGILGLDTDDENIKQAFDLAREQGLEYHFDIKGDDASIHPNTVDIDMVDDTGATAQVRGESLGGGKMRISRINGVGVDISGMYSTLFVAHKDVPGVLAALTNLLAYAHVNIAFCRTYRTEVGGQAYSVFETDGAPDDTVVPMLRKLDNVDYATFIELPGSASSISPGVSAKEIFDDGEQLLDACEELGLSIGAVMAVREARLTGEAHAVAAMRRVLDVMREETTAPIANPQRSLGGLIGGEAKLVEATRCNDLSASLMGAVQTAGAEGGCQAEVGSAAAMAAAALVQMLGGTPEQALDASSIALSNLLGLVCDPVGGLVEVPCQNRNAIGVAAAFSSAQLALAGIKSLVPFDQMAHVMLSVGHALPATLRETAKGGIAQAPAALSACAKCGVCG